MSRGHHPDPPQPAACCSTGKANAGTERKLYQNFIFSIPIAVTFALLFLFYLLYLRCRRIDWSFLRMRSSSLQSSDDDVPRSELGLKKELRELLPIIVFNETFSTKDAQCSVCLGDYQAEERLQQIPGCSHTFHMECIDCWLSTHTTCPLCRLSLLASSKGSVDTSNNQAEVTHRPSNSANEEESSFRNRHQTSQEAGDTINFQSGFEGGQRSPFSTDHERDNLSTGIENESCQSRDKKPNLCSTHELNLQ